MPFRLRIPAAGRGLVVLKNVNMSSSGNTRILDVSGASLTLKLDGDTLSNTNTTTGNNAISNAAMIQLSSPEPILDLTSNNNTFNLNHDSSTGSPVFFIRDTVSPALSTINVEGGDTFNLTIGEDTSHTVSVVNDSRTVIGATKTNPTSFLAFNSANRTFTYTPPANAFSNPSTTPVDIVTLTLSGGATVTVNIFVTAVNDTPVVVIAQPFFTNEDTPVTLSGETSPGSGIQKLGVSDVDDAGQTYTATLTVGDTSSFATNTRGTFHIDNAAAPSVVVGGNDTGTVTLTGTLSAITAVLQDNTGTPGVVFNPALNANNSNNNPNADRISQVAGQRRAAPRAPIPRPLALPPSTMPRRSPPFPLRG